jgi:hypothetical protein
MTINKASHGRPALQAGFNWIGVVLPVARLTAAQMRGLAKIAQDLGDGDIRLTVWQNLLISGVADDKVALAQGAIEAIGLTTKATSIRAGLVACTGNVGCKFAASDTKRHAEEMRNGVRRASISTARSTSISPVAIIPARSITSAISACSPARWRSRMRKPSRVITSMSAAASGRTRHSAAKSTAT